MISKIIEFPKMHHLPKEDPPPEDSLADVQATTQDALVRIIHHAATSSTAVLTPPQIAAVMATELIRFMIVQGYDDGGISAFLDAVDNRVKSARVALDAGSPSSSPSAR